MAVLLGALLLSYLLGSIPAGYLAGRAKGVDLRKHGSGNVGATNVVRVLGKPIGLAVFAFDFVKGFLPAGPLAALLIAREWTPWSPDATRLALGLAAVLGHVFPVWLGFKGGKGVATSGGLCLGLHPLATVLVFLVWLVVFKASRFVSLASMTAAVAFPVIFVLLVGREAAFGERRLVTALACLLAIAILFLHRQNIGRLLRGEELRAGAHRTGDESS